MATDFNYVVNVDTSRVMGAMSEVRSQMGMAMSPQQAGGGFGSVVSGGAMGVGRMGQAMMRFPVGTPGYSGTFTDPAMSYQPHYGVAGAYTTPGMEREIQRDGMLAAARLRPPGVSPGDFFMEVQNNRIERNEEARRQSVSAARTTLMSGAGGLIAGSIAAKGGEVLGARLGGMLGAGKNSLGWKAGGIIGGIGAFMVAENIVGGAIQDHYAAAERIGGVTKEFGDILGAGRGLTRQQRYRMGVGARQAAGDLNMDVQTMGDILAGARRNGMLPTGTGTSEIRTKARELASSIDEAAQMLGSSLGSAMGVIKGMGGMGFGAREGVSKLIGMGSAAGISPMAMYGVGMRGAGVAKQMQMSGRVGFDLFTQGVMQAAGSGLNRQELGYVGGVTGLGQQVAMMQAGHAMSPMGDLQIMSMANGGGLSSDPMEMFGGAMGALMKGGNPLAAYMNYSVNKNKFREAAGAKGMQSMLRKSIMGTAELFSSQFGVSTEVMFRSLAKGRGMSETAAKAYWNMDGTGGGGGIGGGGTALAEAQYNAYSGSIVKGGLASELARLGMDKTIGGRMLDKTKEMIEEGRGAAWGGIGAAGGAIFGGLAGAAMGGGAGYLAGKAYDFIEGGGFNMSWSSGDQADRDYFRSTGKLDRLEKKIRERNGLVQFDRANYARLVGGRVSVDSMEFDLRSVDPRGAASSKILRALTLAGIESVGAGPGTTRIGNQFFKTRDAVGMNGLKGTLRGRGANRRYVSDASDAILNMRTDQASTIQSMGLIYNRAMSGKGGVMDVSRLRRMGIGMLKKAGLNEGFSGSALNATGWRLIGDATGLDMGALVGKLPAGTRARAVIAAAMGGAGNAVQEELRGRLASAAKAGLSEKQIKGKEHLKIAKKLSSSRKFVRLLTSEAYSKGDTQKRAIAEQIRKLTSLTTISSSDKNANTVISRLYGDGKSNVFEMIKGKFKTSKEAADQISGRHRRSMRRTKKTSSGTGGEFNAVGFGDVESSMSLITKSLTKLHSDISTMHRRIQKISKHPT